MTPRATLALALAGAALAGCPRWVLQPPDGAAPDAADALAPDALALDAPPDAHAPDARDTGAERDDGAPADAPDVVADAGCDPATDMACARLIDQIALGTRHACALRRDGQVLCWGANSHGQLGDGATGTRRATPAPVTVAGGAPLSNVTQIDMGENYGCARRTDGTVWCWGSNSRYQIGNTGSAALRAVQVAGLSNVTDLGTARESACAAVASGGVSCWGAAGVGQMGDGSNSGERATPGLVPAPILPGVARVEGGYQHLCAVAPGGVQCWGDNGSGQVADGNPVPAEQTRPVTAPATAGALDVACGYLHTCVLLAGGAVRCWGGGSMGELGYGGMEYNHAAVNVQAAAGANLTGAVAVALGGQNGESSHSCAVLADRSLACWGANYYGQLGVASTEACRGLGTTLRPCSLRAQPVPGVTGVRQVALGGNFTCALLEADRSVHCWGLNTDGQLARDPAATPMTPLPQRVAFP